MIKSIHCIVAVLVLFFFTACATPPPKRQPIDWKKSVSIGVEPCFSESSLGDAAASKTKTLMNKQAIQNGSCTSVFSPSYSHILSETGFWVNDTYLLMALLHQKGEPVFAGIETFAYKSYEANLKKPRLIADAVGEKGMTTLVDGVVDYLSQQKPWYLSKTASGVSSNPAAVVKEIDTLNKNKKYLDAYRSDKLALSACLGWLSQGDAALVQSDFANAIRLYTNTIKDADRIFGRHIKRHFDTPHAVAGGASDGTYVLGSACRSEVIKLYCFFRLSQCYAGLNRPKAREIALINYYLSKTYLLLSEAAKEETLVRDYEAKNYWFTQKYESAQAKKNVAKAAQFPLILAAALGWRVESRVPGFEGEMISYSFGKLEQIKMELSQLQRASLADIRAIGAEMDQYFDEIASRLSRYQQQEHEKFLGEVEQFKQLMLSNASSGKLLDEFKRLQNDFMQFQVSLSENPAYLTPKGTSNGKHPTISTYGLTLNVHPRDAAISFKDKGWQYMPGLELMPGRYTAVVSKKGYIAQELDIHINDRPVELDVRLELSTYRLTVATRPADAKVVINDRMVYRPGMALGPGDYKVTASRNGYVTASKTVSIVDQGMTVSIQLRRKTYRLTVTCEPADASIKIMNIKKAYRPGIRLPMGSYHVEVTRDGYKPQTKTIAVKDRDLSVSVSLEKKSLFERMKDFIKD